MKKILLILLVGLFQNFIFGATITSTGTGGNWNSTTSWVGGIVPGASDDVVIVSGATINVAANTFVKNVTVQNGGTLTVPNTIVFTVYGSVSVNSGGQFNAGTGNSDSAIIKVYGNFTNQGTANFWKSIVVIAGNLSTTSTILQNNGDIIVGGNVTATISGGGNGYVYPVNPGATVSVTGTSNAQPAGTKPTDPVLVALMNEVIYGANCPTSAGTLSGNQNICTNGTTTFTSTISGGSWSSSNTAIANVNFAGVVTPVSAGTATITYSVGGYGSCTSSYTAARSINVASSAPAQPGAISGPLTVCQGATGIVYSVSPVSNATSYNWFFPDTNWQITSGAGTNSVTVRLNAGAGTGNVYVSASNGCGTGNARYDKWVVVSTPTVAGTVTPANTNVCSPSNSTNLSLSGNTGSILRWESSTDNFGGGTITTINSTGSPITASNVTVDTWYRAVVQNGGCNVQYSNSVKITVYGSVTTPGAISVNGVLYPENGNASYCSSSSVVFSIAPVPNATTYTWTIPTGWNLVSGQGTTTATYITGNSSQSENVSVSASNSSICNSPGSRYFYLYLGNAPGSVTINSQSTAGQTRCLGSPFSAITVNASGTGLSYQWYSNTISSNLGGTSLGSSNGAQTSSYTPQSTVVGTLYYYCIVRNCANTSVTSAISGAFVTTSAPSATISYSGSPYCKSLTASQAVTRTGTAGGTYTASPSGLTIDSLTGAITPSTSTAGSYTVTYTYGSSGCTGLTTTANVVITAVPTATISYSGSPYCVSLTGAQAVTQTGTSGGTYSAPPGLTINSTTGAITPSTSTAGSYTVTYTYGSGVCTGITTTATVVITTAPASPGTIAQPASKCAGSTGNTFSITSVTGATSYTWSVTGSGWSVTGGQGTVSAIITIGSGVGTVSVTATNGCGTSLASTTGNITPNTLSIAPTGITGTTTICNGATTTLTVSGGTAGTGAIAEWFTGSCGGTAVGTGNSITVSPTSNTTYYVRYNGTCNTTTCATASVTVNPTPSTPIVDTITNISCTTNTGSVALSGLPSGNWTITSTPAITPITGSGSTTNISGLAAGNYVFTVTNASGCPSPATGNVSISDNSSTTWNGTLWSNGSPDATKNVIIASTPYTFPAGFIACALTINSGVVATVPSGVTLTITNAVTTNGQLIFENTASLYQINNVPNSGVISYKRISQPMKNFDYTYWSSPVAGQTLGNLSPNTLYDKYMSYTGTGWKVEARANIMLPGIGYIIRVPKPNSTYSNGKDYWTGATYAQPVEFIGVPNNGNFQSSQTMAAGNYYLVGNPYPSAMDAEAFLYDNPNNTDVLDGTIYFWTHNTPVNPDLAQYKYYSADYAAYNQSGGTATWYSPGNNAAPDGYIAAGQSFFTLASKPGRVEFNNAMRVGGNNSSFFKPGKTSKSAKLEKHRLWLNLINSGGAFKQTLIGYIEGATNTYDKNFDGISFDGNSYIDFYSVNATDNLTIQGRALPFNDTDAVPLGYRSTIAGDFTIAIDHADGNLATQKVYLEDKQTGTLTELTAGNYTFNTKAGTFNSRFVLRYANKTTLGTGDFETAEDAISILVQDKTITIDSTVENIDKVFIYDIAGKQLYTKEKVNNLQLTMQNLPFAQQVLLVKIFLENGTVTTKKVIFK